MESTAVRYSSPALAQKIAQNYGGKVRKVQVTMVGSEDVSKLIGKIKRAQAKAHTKPMKLD